jgi:hypothetical protein
MNQDIKDSAVLNCGATEEQFLKYCTDLWSDVTYDHKNENFWQIEKQDKQRITKDDLKTAIMR